MAPSIQYYHSGGGGNCNPDLDLGGDISSCVVGDNINDLFSELTPKQSRLGLVDYRCIYVANTSMTDTMRNVVLYIDSERRGGSFVDLGVCQSNEIQTIEVTGPIPPAEGGTLTLDVVDYGSFVVPYHVLLPMWQGRFQTEMRGISGLGEVIVQAVGEIGFPTDVIFTVNFKDESGAHLISLIQVTGNTLLSATISVTEVVPGCPVNTTAVTIPKTTTAPANVVFTYPLRGNPIQLGDLLPQDSFPLWFRRTTPANTLAYTKDDIILRIDGTFP
jgi:hypothetical protein